MSYFEVRNFKADLILHSSDLRTSIFHCAAQLVKQSDFFWLGEILWKSSEKELGGEIAEHSDRCLPAFRLTFDGTNHSLPLPPPPRTPLDVTSLLPVQK